MGDTARRAAGRLSLAVRRRRGPLLFLAGFAGMQYLGWVVFPPLLYSATEQPVHFSHRTHKGEAAGLSCADCHPFRDDGRFAGIPTLETCAGCHEQPAGSSEAEKRFIDEYVTPKREVPWLVYSRQPPNAYFSHVQHVKGAKLECAACHGDHGDLDALPPYRANRISGYSRANGPATDGVALLPTEVMRMDTCAECHERSGRRSGCLECHK